MLTCIACSKQLRDAAEDEPARGTPSTKEAVKSLTSQIKEMVLRFSGAYRQCKPCAGGASTSSSGAHRKGGAGVGHHGRPYGNFDVSSEAGGGAMGSHYQHLMAGGSSTSTPGWDFTSINAESADARFTNGGGARWWAPGIGMPGVDRPREEVGPYDVVLEEDDGEPKEWMAQVEPGVHITFISLPGGGNDLKRIRFSREMFNKWQAQRWWGENYDRIMELYNVQRFSRQALPTPPRSEDEFQEVAVCRIRHRKPDKEERLPPYARAKRLRAGESTREVVGESSGRVTTPPGRCEAAVPLAFSVPRAEPTTVDPAPAFPPGVGHHGCQASLHPPSPVVGAESHPAPQQGAEAAGGGPQQGVEAAGGGQPRTVRSSTHLPESEEAIGLRAYTLALFPLVPGVHANALNLGAEMRGTHLPESDEAIGLRAYTLSLFPLVPGVHASALNLGAAMPAGETYGAQAGTTPEDREVPPDKI